ncbi:MAG: PAS domain-containing protein [Nitrospirae bacterium]|nr:PAS domain-containing protein [Nitrospirota bacterium]
MKNKDSSIKHLLSELIEQEILDAFGDGVSIQDTNFKILYQNNTHKNFIGDHTGRYCYEAYEHREKTCEGCPLDTAFKNGGIHTTERSVSTDNGVKYLEITASVLKDETGKILAGIEIVRDTTWRRETSEALRKNEKFLNDVFDSIQDGISILDKDMNIIRVNHAMERWYSHAIPLVGKKCYDAYHSRSDRCEVCPSRQTLETGESSYNVVPKRGPGGEITGWLDLYSFPWIDIQTQELKGVIEYVRDITERKKLEDDLKKRVNELEEFYQMAIGRELKMKELKNEMQELKSRLARYET